jgi:hypothetical protein
MMIIMFPREPTAFLDEALSTVDLDNADFK